MCYRQGLKFCAAMGVLGDLRTFPFCFALTQGETREYLLFVYKALLYLASDAANTSFFQGTSLLISDNSTAKVGAHEQLVCETTMQNVSARFGTRDSPPAIGTWCVQIALS